MDRYKAVKNRKQNTYFGGAPRNWLIGFSAAFLAVIYCGERLALNMPFVLLAGSIAFVASSRIHAGGRPVERREVILADEQIVRWKRRSAETILLMTILFATVAVLIGWSVLVNFWKEYP